MCISTNIHKPSASDPLGPYISLVHNSINQITLYCSTLINYPHQHIDQLMKDRFNPIDRFSSQTVGCQAMSHTLGVMEYIRTPFMEPVHHQLSCIYIILHPYKSHE